jgi:hypothetical protein
LSCHKDFKKLDEISVLGKKDLWKRKLPPNKQEKIISFGATMRLRFSAFQTLSLSNLLTFTLRRPSELRLTFATKKLCNESSSPPSFEYSPDCISFGTYKFSNSPHQLSIFFISKKYIHSFAIRQSTDNETLECNF